MTNLPIAGNTSQPSGNALSAAQASSIADDPVAGLFAALLAQQIDPGDLSAQLAMTADGAITDGHTNSDATEDAADAPAIITAEVRGDATDALAAAILLQIPRESKDTEPRVNGNAANSRIAPADSRKVADSAAFGGDSGAGITPETAASAQNRRGAAVVAAGNPHLAEAAGKDAPEHAGLPAIAAEPSRPAMNTAQAHVPAVAMENMLASRHGAGNPQTIGTPLGNVGWADEFSQKIIWAGAQQIQSAELHLNPPDLGPLNVSLKIADNQATALFTSPHGAVRDAIENALPKLCEMLADNGITLGNATVSDQPAHDRSAENSTGHGSGTNTHRMTDDEASRAAEPAPATAQGATIRRHHGMVDTFA